MITPLLPDTGGVPMRVSAEAGLKLRATPNGALIRIMPLGESVTGYPATKQRQGDYDWIGVRDALGNTGYSASMYLTAVPVETPYRLGIDISQAQTAIDWASVKAAGYSFAFVRAAQGKADSRPVGVDTRFVAHIEAALSVSMDVGAYHAFIASVEGNAQAQFFMTTVLPYLDKLAFPLVIDVELDNGQTPAVISGRLFDMTSTLFALGAGLPMIYTSPGFWDAHTDRRNDDYFARCPLWVANWTSAPQPLLPRAWKGKAWTVWQYSSKARVPGYSKNIDVNRMRT